MESATGPKTTTGTDQAAHFGRMAADWWDPKGSSRMLHRLNPVRLRYIRDTVDAHWHGDPKSRTPLSGKRVLDFGCGAGLLTEPLTRLGGKVTGVDAALENIAVAQAHAAQSGLAIDYRTGGTEVVAGERFDLSKFAIIGIGETLGGIPTGTHDWDSFVTPEELSAHVAAAGLTVVETRGMKFGPARGFHLSDDEKLDYFLVAHA